MSLIVASVELKVPDNAAFTAYDTLKRMGLDELGDVQRSDVWLVEADALPQQILESLKRTEVIYNPNKHALRALSSDRPAAGEIWVATAGRSHEREARLLAQAGLTGVRSVESRVRWLLLDERGEPLGRSALDRARGLFANPAYQDALTA
ncbi:MAG TPA: hypothetical protein VNJ51_04920 [Candidatus Dormibacteraeota bacterium]|nr:hypothetical protein [Candidatus Dormibacteraeota bacterium]